MNTSADTMDHKPKGMTHPLSELLDKSKQFHQIKASMSAVGAEAAPAGKAAVAKSSKMRSGLGKRGGGMMVATGGGGALSKTDRASVANAVGADPFATSKALDQAHVAMEKNLKEVADTYKKTIEHDLQLIQSQLTGSQDKYERQLYKCVPPSLCGCLSLCRE